MPPYEEGAPPDVGRQSIADARFGLAWTLPITTGPQEAARGLTAVSLMGTGLPVTGNVLCHQIKALDWSARQARSIARLKGPVLDQIMDVCLAIMDPARRG